MTNALIYTAIIFIVVAGSTLKTANNKAQQRHIMLGVWTEGLFDAKTQKLNPEILLQFEQMVGKKVEIAHYYRGWESWIDPNLKTEFDLLNANGWTPMLNANPYFFDECPTVEKPLYKAIADGHCDEFLKKASNNIAQIEQPFYLLFAWEMNNKELEWSIPYTGSSPEDFVAAWRHIHTLFKEVGVTNIIWVFNPNIPNTPDAPYKELYPGNDYVDWVGLDGYNWGTTQSWSKWYSFSEVFKGPYDQLTEIAPDKPVMISEVNTTDQGGDKGSWYIDALTNEIPHNFPNIKAVIIYNEDRTSQENVNWKVDVSAETLESFIKAIHSGYY